MATATDQLRVRDARLAEADVARRNDRWWIAPVLTVLVLSAFVIYGLYVTFVNKNYYADPYLSPFYSPCLATNCRGPSWNVIGSWYTISDHPPVPARLPSHLLLLPQGVLPLVLLGAARVRDSRRAIALHG
jgi:hypothetical protein